MARSISGRAKSTARPVPPQHGQRFSPLKVTILGDDLYTKGYNLEHNFGHGKQHLSSLLATLNILSLLFHTLLELLDQKYKLLRSHLPTRKNLLR